MLDRMLLASPSDEKLYVEDVFSTYLYTGVTGDNQTITNGIDLAGKGGLVWAKSRNVAQDHFLTDTASGVALSSNKTSAGYSYSGYFTPLSNGYTSGFGTTTGYTYASWTFRKAPKFFDVVTYTGNGTFVRQINHSLGVTPGFIVVKRTDSTGNWMCVHRNNPMGELVLNSSAANTGNTDNIEVWTSTYIGVSNAANVNGGTYVAYLFAHDPTADGIIQCGSLSASGEVNLGWEPQWILHKPHTTASTNWRIVDNMRGMPVGGNEAVLVPNISDAESSSLDFISPTATGFDYKLSTPAIYIAIRRGPMKTPTVGTSVFMPVANSDSPNTPYFTGFPVDWILTRKRAADDTYVGTRLTGNGKYLTTDTANAESSYTTWYFDKNTGTMASNVHTSAQSYIYWNFARAPGFFDVVCYTGTGVARTVNHNLGVAPELMVVKDRTNASTNWRVYATPLTASYNANLNLSNTPVFNGIWNYTAPTSTVFSLNGAGYQANDSGANYVAYLFASCPGVSKVFSFTGNGSSQTINCGFSGGARFVMIKRTDSAGDWYVWDTARGLVTGNDPHLSLNTTAAEVTTDDTIDPDSTGFIVNQVSATNVNVSGASYIGLAVA